MPKTERELRVVGTPSYQFADAKNWKEGHIVMLESDDEGNVGGLDAQMLEDLDGALFILRELVSQEASVLVDEGRLARISYAIQRILREAQGGD